MPAIAVDPTSPPTEPATVAPAARDAILAWYAEHGRPLAFRRTSDPYPILVSEAMAQQTQAARAAAYWERFIERYPTVHDLADASPGDVLRAWAGLGYDRRALALWRAARMIVDDFDGRVPDTVEELQRLPGVGPYTARAVAALAYGRPVGAVDVNVRRVLGRMVIGAPDRIDASVIQDIADTAVPLDRPGAWTHALMDLGATTCRPRTPRCEGCPAMPWCTFAGRRRAAPDVPESPVAPTVVAPRGRGHAPPFPSTNRWLRGRILDRARAASDSSWVVLDGPIGEHDADRVAAAAVAMAGDGLLEVDRVTDGALRIRLPLA